MTGGSVDPLGKHWKYNIGGPVNFAGRITEGDPGEYIAQVIAGTFTEGQKPAAINDSGQVLSAGTLGDDAKTAIISGIQEKYGCVISEVELDLMEIKAGDMIPDWDTYESI